ncbi:MAG: Ada metal-binding protein [Pelosinus sp.]|jgi:AraC family transcriptional regulator of adaptative response / methylphosphotriester-DNA alkyltransferase methyltransferase|nr:Ada metal-binding protein [Pelosinus sp.]
MVLLEKEQWKAVEQCDSKYDGAFFYAVKTTGIVCRPSCKSKVPNRDNVSFFTTLDDALRQGYRICKRCRPDLGAQYMPELELVKTACDIMKQEYFNLILLRELPLRLNVSSSHFQRMFKKIVSRTPKKYLSTLRIEKAIELLDSSTMSIMDISLEVGFASLSSFYLAFRAEMVCSPSEYRRGQSNNDGNQTRRGER